MLTGLGLQAISNSLQSLGKTFLNRTSVSSTIEIKLRKELFSKIKRDNYEKMKENVSRLSTDDNVVSSTNVVKFFEMFEKDETFISPIFHYLIF